MEPLLSGILLVLVVDQATKMVVLSALGEGRSVSVGCRLRVRRLTNTKTLLGHFITPRALVIVWAMTTFGLLMLVQHGPFLQSPASRLALGCALGGATSNLGDRLWRGGVIDFIDVGFWPVFNVADSAIVAGVVLALWFIR